LEEPKKTKNGMIYGVYKFRGTTPDETSAQKRAADIIREVDSRNPVHMVRVGTWYPITSDPSHIENLTEVQDDEVDQAKVKAEEERQSRQKQVMRTIKEREEDLKKNDLHDDPESLKYYIMRRVVWRTLRSTLELKEKELATLREKLYNVHGELHKKDAVHPDYDELWLEEYNKSLKDVGAPPCVPSKDEITEYRRNPSPPTSSSK